MAAALGVAALLAGTDGPARAELPTLTLEEATRALDAESLTLAQARSRAAEASALVRQAWVALLPTVSASGSFVRNSDEAQIPIGLLFDRLGIPGPGMPDSVYIQPQQVWSVAGAVRVPLIVPSAWADVAAARSSREAAETSTQVAGLQLRAALAQSAWAAQMAEEIVAASERAVTTAEEHRASAARAVEAGTAAPLSVLKAETEIVRRQSDLARVRAELARARLALGILLARPGPLRVTVPDGGPAEQVVGGADLSREALAARPELRAQDAQVRAARHQVSSARWRLAPQLSGSFAAFAQDVPLPTGKRQGWRATVDLTWPLFDGGFRYARRRQAEAALETARLAARAQSLAIVQEVEDARRDVEVARERVTLAEKQRVFAAEAAASAKRTFEGGVSGSLEVLDANDRLYLADVALAEARGRLALARVALGKALGRI